MTSDAKSESEVKGTSAGAGTSLSDTASAYRSAGAETTSDVGQAEAYLVNMKRLVADELDHDQFFRSNRERIIRNGEDGDQTHRSQGERAIEQSLELQNKLNDQYLSLIAQLNAASISERERTVRVGDVANDHMWTSNAAFDAIVETTVAKVLAKLGYKPSA